MNIKCMFSAWAGVCGVLFSAELSREHWGHINPAGSLQQSQRVTTDTKPILQRKKLNQRVRQSLLRVRELIGSRVGAKPTLLALCITGDVGSRWLVHPRMPSLPSVQDKHAQSSRDTNRAVLVGREDRPVGLAQVEKYPCQSPRWRWLQGQQMASRRGHFMRAATLPPGSVHVAAPCMGFQHQGGHLLPTQPQTRLQSLGSGKPSSPRVVVRM